MMTPEKYFFSDGVRRAMSARPRDTASGCWDLRTSQRASRKFSVVATRSSTRQASNSTRAASTSGSMSVSSRRSLEKPAPFFGGRPIGFFPAPFFPPDADDFPATAPPVPLELLKLLRLLEIG